MATASSRREGGEGRGGEGRGGEGRGRRGDEDENEQIGSKDMSTLYYNTPQPLFSQLFFPPPPPPLPGPHPAWVVLHKHKSYQLSHFVSNKGLVCRSLDEGCAEPG